MEEKLKNKTEFCRGQKIRCNLEGGVHEEFVKDFEFFERDIKRPVIVIEIIKVDSNHDYLNEKELKIFPNYQINNSQDYSNWIEKLKELNIIRPIV